MKYSREIFILLISLGCSRNTTTVTNIDPHFIGDSLMMPPRMRNAWDAVSRGYTPMNPSEFVHMSHMETHGRGVWEDPPFPTRPGFRTQAAISDFDGDGRLDVIVLEERADSSRVVAVLAEPPRVFELARWSIVLPPGMRRVGEWRVPAYEWLTDRTVRGLDSLDAERDRVVLLERSGQDPVVWKWNGREFDRVP